MIQNVQTALATKVQNASTIFRKKQSNYLKRGSRATLFCNSAVSTADAPSRSPLRYSVSRASGTRPELRGHEIRNQDILAASGAVPIKDSYASVNDDLALVRQSLAINIPRRCRADWLFAPGLRNSPKTP